MRRPVTEEQVPVGWLVAVLPAHDVGAHARERLLGRDEISPGTVHLTTVLVEHLFVAENRSERRLVDETNRHEQL